MATIQDYLDLIKNAIYGKDVRQAIHDGILQCYLDASGDHYEKLDREVGLLKNDTKSLKSNKVNQPLDVNNQPTNGVSGQSLRTKGNGLTEWADVGLPTDAQTAQAVSDWLDNHPEATTTVQDHSLTYQKLVNGTLGFVTPEMFGAKGDGFTDDSVAFVSCFGGGYKNVHIPNGNYILSQKITIPDGTTVTCDGTIKKSGAFDILFELGNNCDVQLNIDLDRASATDYTSSNSADIYINGKSNVSVHDTKIANTDSRYAIWIEKSTHINISNCDVNTYVETGIGCRDGNNDIRILNNSVINGHGIQPNRYPICLNSSAGLTVSSNVVCDGNYIEDYESRWEGIDAHDLKDSIITNNTIVNTVAGIVLTRQDTPSENVVISNNVFSNTLAHDVVASTYGIICCVVGGSKNITISNNILTGCGNNTGTTDIGGINVYGVTDAKIVNNNIEVVYGNGIKITSISNLETKDFVIESNTISGAETGIQLINATGISVVGDIRNNTIKNCTLGLSGMTANGNGYESCVFAKDNKFINCITNFDNYTKGLLVSPSSIDSSEFGRVGQIIDFERPNSGYLRSICIASGTATTLAQWTKQLNVFEIYGTYTATNGVFEIANNNVLGTAYCVGNVVYSSASDLGRVINAYCVTRKIIVYVTEADGTPVNGSVTIALMVTNRRS